MEPPESHSITYTPKVTPNDIFRIATESHSVLQRAHHEEKQWQEAQTRDRYITSENHRHQLNLALNRCIKTMLENYPHNKRSQVAKHLSRQKRTFIDTCNTTHTLDQLTEEFKSVNDVERYETMSVT
jgi:hypothetical protein